MKVIKHCWQVLDGPGTILKVLGKSCMVLGRIWKACRCMEALGRPLEGSWKVLGAHSKVLHDPGKNPSWKLMERSSKSLEGLETSWNAFGKPSNAFGILWHDVLGSPWTVWASPGRPWRTMEVPGCFLERLGSRWKVLEGEGNCWKVSQGRATLLEALGKSSNASGTPTGRSWDALRTPLGRPWNAFWGLRHGLNGAATGRAAHRRPPSPDKYKYCTWAGPLAKLRDRRQSRQNPGTRTVQKVSPIWGAIAFEVTQLAAAGPRHANPDPPRPSNFALGGKWPRRKRVSLCASEGALPSHGARATLIRRARPLRKLIRAATAAA